VRVLDDLTTGNRERLAALDGVELLQGDVRNPAAVQRALQDVNAVVHLAGVHPGVDPLRAQEVNLGGALHLFNFARDVAKRERPRIVLCGSASVYGKQSSMVLHEELQPRPMTPEAVMALCIEHYGRVYRETFGVPVVSLRLFRVFGPGEDASRPDTGPVARFIRAALDGKAPVIFGDGQQTRDLIYIDNVVAAIIAALDVEDPPVDPINIASGEAVAVSFLWTLILELCGKKRAAIPPTYVPAPSWDPRNSRPQIARACKVLGWAPAVRLREGLAQTVEHYRALRNVDPNAWFTPRHERAPKAPAESPVPTQTRRFGSVVTPAFGTPVIPPSGRNGNKSEGSQPRAVLDAARNRPSTPPPPPRAGATRSSSASEASPPRSRSEPSRARANGAHEGKLAAAGGSTPLPTPASASASKRPLRQPAAEILEISEAEIVEDAPPPKIALSDLDFEWAPVPAVPGLGR
jgi:nucleoside-diphosphate-sugar epimerase